MAFNFLSPAIRSRVQKRLFGTNSHGSSAALDENDLNRLARNDEHWAFYFGKQWDFQRQDNEPLVTINTIKAIIDKAVAFLCGAGFRIEVPKVLENLTLPILQDVWSENKKQSFTIQAGFMGAVTGDVFVLVTYQDPTELEKRLNPYAQGKVRLILLDSSQVIPTWNPLDLDELLSISVVTPFMDRSNVDASTSSGAQAGVVRRLIQNINPSFIEEYEEGNEESRKVFENILGEIPVIHIRNMAIPKEFYGKSDLDGGALDLQREQNEKATDMSDIINYNGSPITVIKGAKASALERGPKQIWSGLPKDATVEHLTLSGDFGPFMDYLKFVKKSLLEQTQTPEKSLGEDNPISNTSGVALSEQMKVLVEKNAFKKAEYEPGFSEINRIILRIKQLKEGLILPYDLCESCGGKMHIYTDPMTKRIMKKCYLVDRNTFDFLAPDDAPVTVIREHSFGRELREITFRQFKDEYGKENPSFFDPAAEKPLDITQTNPLTTRPNAKTLRMKAGLFKLPEEPEEFTAEMVVSIDPATGEQVTEVRKIIAVPTGCARPRFLNPYKNSVVFESTMPKDKHLEAGYVGNLVNQKLRSRKWAMTQIGVENTEEEEQQILREQALYGETKPEDIIENEPSEPGAQGVSGPGSTPADRKGATASSKIKQTDLTRSPKPISPESITTE